MNKAILIGNLGADPESRQTNSGTTVCSLRVATNERRKGQDGNWNDHTEWHRVTCFGRTAENAARFLQKGSKVAIEGRIETRKWQDKEGRDRYTTGIVCDRLEFVDSRGDGGGQRSGGQSGGYGGGGNQSGNHGGSSYGGGQSNGSGYGGHDDIPF